MPAPVFPIVRLATPEEIKWHEVSQQFGPGTLHDISDKHHLPMNTVGFGRTAVGAALNDIQTFGPFVFELEGDYLRVGPDEDVNIKRRSEVRRARNYLAGLSVEQVRLADSFFRFEEAPEWLQHAVGVESPLEEDGEEGHIKLTAKLNEKDNEGNFTVSNRTFLNILEWHNHRLVGEQPKFAEKIEQFKAEFERAAREVVAYGGLPEVVLSRLGRVRAATVLVDDGFDTILLGTAGYKSNDSNGQTALVVLAPGKIGDNHVFMHESMHVIQGKDTPGFDNAYSGTAIGKLFNHSEFVTKAIIEACVEHVAGVFGGDDLQDLAPRREKVAKAYVAGRKLLHYLSELGEQKIDVCLFLAALMEDADVADALGDDSATARLGRELKLAFPRSDVLNDLSKLASKDDLYTFIASSNANL
ncbi:hypothetical protein JNM87_06335 [Candidatus Saccharibacteria bacterium]|nr:hypothetical protein [Candidatus Saccharibacteria bacterium]